MQGVSTIGKGRFPARREETGKRLRINEQIRISPLRLIDDNNEQVGIIEREDAMRRAKEAGLDLVEVAPNTRPPVCRIMDYGKWKYQQKKKEQKAKSHSKASELKEIRLRPGTDDHDIDIKITKAREFLEEGHKVQFTILFKGRQMAHRELGFDLCKRIVDVNQDIAHVEMTPRLQGRRMTMTMAHGAKAKPTGPIGGAPRPVRPAPPPRPAAAAAAQAAAPQPEPTPEPSKA